MSLPGETLRLAYPTLPALENPAYVSYGRPHEELCAHHVKNTFNAKRVYLIVSSSLSKQTDEVSKLKSALGDRLAGIRVGILPHTPWNEVLDATKEAKALNADCLITLGGGSLVDGAKAMLLFLANNITTIPEIYDFAPRVPASHQQMGALSAKTLDCICPTIPLICITTTLSGGEFSWFAGGTDPTTHRKLIMGHPFCGPRLIINDPKLTLTTPEWVWLSTGVRAIDHCVESFCCLVRDDEDVNAAELEAFQAIVPNLLLTKKDWTNESARLETQLGVCSAMIMLKKAVPPGASHGIGHQLGPLGVGHGETSCILLPSVMKYNARVNGHKQAALKRFVWSSPPVAEVLRKRGLREEESDMGDCLDAIFRELGMPRSLAEKGIGKDKFEGLAVNSLTDPCCKANPVPLERKEQVLEILEMCAG